MKAFLSNKKPKSMQSGTKSKYQEHLKDAYNKYCNSDEFEVVPLYGKAYYFHKESTQLDADNMSKPIWDALEGLAYEDDSIIKLRHAGIVDLRETDLELFDLSSIPDNVANSFLDMIGSEKHILYIELGKLRNDMIVFGEL
ncbi:RusA family crossover junction endodeoxyribonuclease [Desulfococcaceae bacterium HSG8]|nr:RusA family crossover junction endodeoxyribonuclease [Desulfococcaceae bacterium HSG8]